MSNVKLPKLDKQIFHASLRFNFRARDINVQKRINVTF